MKDERAQATIEFALISMSLLTFIIGALDLGRAMYYYNSLASVARDGARFASVLSEGDWTIDGNSPGTYKASSYIGTNTVVGASSKRGVGMDTASLQVTVSTPMGTATGFALPVVVSAEYGYHPFSGSLLGVGPITVTAQSTMRMR